MSFRCFWGVAAVLAAGHAMAQDETAPAAVVTAAPAEAPAEVSVLTEAHGPAQPGDAKAGEAKAAVCGACHGADGNSQDPQYPKLAGQHERYLARHLALFKSGERENAIMLGFAAALTPQDMRDLGAYFASTQPLPGVADETPVPQGPNAGKPFYTIGEHLYRGGDAERGLPACMACHGPAGAGNPGVPYPRIAGQHASYTANLLRRFRAGTVYGKGDNANKVMSEVASRLLDEEITALATYVEGLHANEETRAIPHGTPAAP